MGYIVRTYVDGIEIDTQSVNDQTELKDNSFVTFNKEQPLAVNGGDVFTGGTDGQVDGAKHQKARELFETVYTNIIAVPTTDKEIQDAYIAYVKRMRDEYGIKFQIVLPAINRETPINYEGVIEYVNRVTNPIKDPQADLCYWLAGAEAGCLVQNSCTAKAYDGRFDISAKVTRAEQTKAIKNGQILFHRVAEGVVILSDVNTLIKINNEDLNSKHLDFGKNQVVRVFDGITTETANIFNTYFLGKRNNNTVERGELRNQLLKVRERYAQIGAIADYDQSLLEIIPGSKPNEVIGSDGIYPLQAMEILYFTIQYLGNLA